MCMYVNIPEKTCIPYVRVHRICIVEDLVFNIPILIARTRMVWFHVLVPPLKTDSVVLPKTERFIDQRFQLIQDLTVIHKHRFLMIVIFDLDKRQPMCRNRSTC